jgi:hypothetical protein
MEILEARHQLKPQQVAKGKGNFTLAMRIHIGAVHLHGCTVAHDTFNHRSCL